MMRPQGSCAGGVCSAPCSAARKAPASRCPMTGKAGSCAKPAVSTSTGAEGRAARARSASRRAATPAGVPACRWCTRTSPVPAAQAAAHMLQSLVATRRAGGVCDCSAKWCGPSICTATAGPGNHMSRAPRHQGTRASRTHNSGMHASSKLWCASRSGAVGCRSPAAAWASASHQQQSSCAAQCSALGVHKV